MVIADGRVWLGDGTPAGEMLACLKQYGELSTAQLIAGAWVTAADGRRLINRLRRSGKITGPPTWAPFSFSALWTLVDTSN